MVHVQGSNMTTIHKSARPEDLKIDTPIYGLPATAPENFGAVQKGHVPPNANSTGPPGAGHAHVSRGKSNPENAVVLRNTGAGGGPVPMQRVELASQAVHVHVEVSFPQASSSSSSVVTTRVTLENPTQAVRGPLDAPQISGHSGGTLVSTASNAGTPFLPPHPALPPPLPSPSNGHVDAVQYSGTPVPGRRAPTCRDETGTKSAGRVPGTTVEMSEAESVVDQAPEHTAKKGSRAEDYPDPNPMYLYEVEAKLLEQPTAPSGDLSNGVGPGVPSADDSQPMSDGSNGNVTRVREPMTEILEAQPLGVLVPKLLPPVETFNIQMPGRPDCSARLRFLGYRPSLFPGRQCPTPLPHTFTLHRNAQCNPTP